MHISEQLKVLLEASYKNLASFDLYRRANLFKMVNSELRVDECLVANIKEALILITTDVYIGKV